MASDVEVERAVLRVYAERTDDPLRRMTTAQVIANELFERGAYAYDVTKRNAVDRAISRGRRPHRNPRPRQR
jgi:hypothetical protein